MPKAFVLLNTELHSEADVLKELTKIEGVEEAFLVTGVSAGEAFLIAGVYDIIAKVGAETMGKLKEITWRIRKIDKVTSTLTMIMQECNI
jgi:DNA-binding Lrp family transcriptional regulator